MQMALKEAQYKAEVLDMKRRAHLEKLKAQEIRGTATSPGYRGEKGIVLREDDIGGVIGFESSILAPNALQVIQVAPQTNFLATRFTATAPNLDSWRILSMVVGITNQFGNGNSVRARTFAPDSVNGGLRLRGATPGVNIQVSIQNIGNINDTFAGTFWGQIRETSGYRQ
jgi:hypothetical protein